MVVYKPLVSISCVTFNHEQYIEETLESLLRQETDFDYEILVHDDASTDKTKSIIEDFQRKYPTIIKPIYQEQNQFSQGRDVTQINLKRAEGEFIAFCDGDDYWVDTNKLQVQVENLGNLPGCGLCFHPSLIINEKTGSTYFHESISYDNLRIFSIQEVIRGGGWFIPTSSIMIRREILPEIESKPSFVKFEFTDYFIQIIASKKGGALFLKNLTSVYRINSQSSIMGEIFKSEEKTLKFRRASLSFLKQLDTYLDYEHKSTINNLINKTMIQIFKDRRIKTQSKIDILNENSYLISLKNKTICLCFLLLYSAIKPFIKYTN